MRLRAVRTLVLASAAALLAALVVVVLPPAAHAATASFTKTSEWGTGYEGRFTVTNQTSQPIDGWQVQFQLPAGTSVGSFWDALISSSDQRYTATNRTYNGSVAPGASVSFGFIASGTGSPSGCTINGDPCDPGGPPPTTAPPTTAPPTTPPPTTPPPPPPPPGEIRSAPYIDITRTSPSMTDVAAATGQRHFTMAFVLGSAGGCDPRWGGTIPLDDPRIVNDIAGVRNLGGDVIVAFGGAIGPYLEHVCGSVTELADAYKQVIDALDIAHLDIDVEAPVPLDRMNQALAQVQQDRPGVTVSYTLMVQGDDFGLTPALGVDVLVNAKAHGVDVHVVNPMTMEFGSSRPNWGDAVIAAAESTLAQMADIWPEKSTAQRHRMLGVTPMIGRNFNGRIFDQGHAHQLVAWANANQIGLLSFWSVGRDNGSCPGGAVSPSCSSIAQSTYEFTLIYQGFTG